MSYLSINNLYNDQTILMFRECYAMEKIHGTSAHVSYENSELKFFSGGEKHGNFIELFDAEQLKTAFAGLGHASRICVYGEVYGGSCQGMRETYGNKLKFIGFEVQIGDTWLKVPDAEDVCKKLGIEFVYYTKCSTDLKSLDAERDNQSIQAIRNGCGEGKMREGIVLRPLFEFTGNNGGRVIAKHKRDEFKETATPRKVDVSQQVALDNATDVANEWVTDMRLQHVLDKLPGHSIEQAKKIIEAMVADVLREATTEVIDSREVRQAISRRTMVLYKQGLKNALNVPAPQ